jgi:hypothetical protein
MATPSLQWSAAEVTGGTLTVPIEGDRPKGWKDKFQQVVALLGDTQWGEVTYKSSTILVREISEGSEESLHHFLEAVMQETNAAFATEEAGSNDEAEDEGDSADGDADDTDARLTEAFRNFAG